MDGGDVAIVDIVTSHGGRRVHWQLAHYDQINALSIYPSFLPLRWLNSNIRLPPPSPPPFHEKSSLETEGRQFVWRFRKWQ